TVEAKRPERCDGLFGLRYLVRPAVHEAYAAFERSVRKGRPQRLADHLARCALGVVAGLWPKGDPASGELGRPGRALAGAAGALLAIRLCAPAGNLCARLGAVGARTLGRELGGHHLMKEGDVDEGAEVLGVQLDDPHELTGVIASLHQQVGLS